MIRRTIAAALLAGLASPVLAGQLASPTYDQAAGLTNGKAQADAAYDGETLRDAVAAPAVAGSLGKMPAQTALTSARPAFSAPVPAPAKEATGSLFSVHGVLYGTDGAPAEKEFERPLRAAAGALAGAAAGLGIGFAMSKMLS